MDNAPNKRPDPYGYLNLYLDHMRRKHEREKRIESKKQDKESVLRLSSSLGGRSSWNSRPEGKALMIRLKDKQMHILNNLIIG